MNERESLINFNYKTDFITNGEGRNVLSAIEDGLRKCNEFLISVAFITAEGLLTLKPILKELEDKGIRGRILTTDYLGFNSPQVLDDLHGLRNVELKIYCTTRGSHPGFHTKGYIFKQKEECQIIIGSSNLTINALKRNKEWNTRNSVLASDAYTQEVMEEFESYWNSAAAMTYEDFIPWYRPRWVRPNRESWQTLVEQVQEYNQPKKQLEPNLMQQQFTQNFEELRKQGENRGLLISATGTGKTYAAAFAMREVQPKRLLFLVHREQIAKQAKRSFERVFGTDEITYGIVSGHVKDFDKQFVFSTMQMIGKDESLARYSVDAFDYIVIDEVHRAGAHSYQKIIDYFQPTFLLGMTASPDRTDGYDLYGLFNHNIIYEIRLQQALEEDLLCPFHYFGLSDLWVDGEQQDLDLVSFSNLSTTERVDKIIEKIRYFGHSGSRVKGLVFCSNKEEARSLSRAFNERSYQTCCLTGDDSQEKREEAIERLVKNFPGEPEKQLDYIFTVDIFNEGVDIPEVNQVIMLRQTESPIVFIQQLGRGLRKFEDKEYVVILDFIGNYTNNFMIPLALSGDRSYNKDTLRRYVQEGNRVIPGKSTIHFDAISKKRIFESIDTAKFSDVKLIRESYQALRFKLGRIPKLKDFEDYGSIDVLRVFTKFDSYHAFLQKVEKEDYQISFNSTQEQLLKFVSQKLAGGLRIHELLVLQSLVQGIHENNINQDIMTPVLQELQNSYGVRITENTAESIANVLTNVFPTSVARKGFNECVCITETEYGYVISDTLKRALGNDEFARQFQEVLDFGLRRFHREYQNHYGDSTFCLYKKYTYEDVCRLLEWERNEVPLNIGGYKYDKRTETYPVFINYHKSEDIQDTIKYEDRFVSPTILKAISKSKRTLESEDVINAFEADSRSIRMDLFVRKNKDDNESKEFYYLGRIHSTGKEHAKEILMADGKTKAVELEYRLEVPVRDDMYDYIVNG